MNEENNGNRTFVLKEEGAFLDVSKEDNRITVLSDLKMSHYNKLVKQDSKDAEEIQQIIYYASSLKQVVNNYLENNYTVFTTAEDIFVVAAAVEFLSESELGSLVVLDSTDGRSIYKEHRFDIPRLKWIEYEPINSLPPSEYKKLNTKLSADKKKLTSEINKLVEEQGDSDVHSDTITELRSERREIGKLLTDKFLTLSTLSRVALDLTNILSLLRIGNGVNEVNRMACSEALNKGYSTIVYSLTESAKKGEYVHRELKDDIAALKSIRSSVNSKISEHVASELFFPLNKLSNLTKGTRLKTADLTIYETSPNVKGLDIKTVRKPKPSFIPFPTLYSEGTLEIMNTEGNREVFGTPTRLVIGISSNDNEGDEDDEDLEDMMNRPLTLFNENTLNDVLERKINSFLNNGAIVATYINRSQGIGTDSTEVLMGAINSRRANGNNSSKGIVFYSGIENPTEEDNELLSDLKEYPEITIVNPLVMSGIYVGETKDKLGNNVANSFTDINIEYKVMSEICDSLTVNTSNNKSPTNLINMFLLKDKTAGLTKKNKDGMYLSTKNGPTKKDLLVKSGEHTGVYRTMLNMYSDIDEKLSIDVCLNIFKPDYKSIFSGEIPTKGELNPEGVNVKSKEIESF